MNILIIRQDKLRVHQDYLYVKLYAKKHGVNARIKTFNESLHPSLIVNYIQQSGSDYDIILLDGDLGCSCDQPFNSDFQKYFSEAESAFVRSKVIVRSTSPYCIDCAKKLRLNAIADQESWQLAEYIYERSMPTALQFADRANFGLMYSHI
ncbi:MAG: hypothetical protein P1U40_04395 [Coxiellaceae bacterium]|nr:hypothetical protein [Coxiellaceae bacterium]